MCLTVKNYWGLLSGTEDCLQRLTERTFYGVSTLSGLPIGNLFQSCKEAAEVYSRVGWVKGVS